MLRGEVVRFYFTNTANTRVFNVTLPGAQMKLVGADAGHYEHEKFVDEVLLAPSERVVVDVLFPDAGDSSLPAPNARTHLPARVGHRNRHQAAEQSFADEFARLRANRDMTELRERIEAVLQRRRRTRRSRSSTRSDGHGRARGRASDLNVCPMHPDVVSEEPGSCPKCGMKLLAQAAEETTYVLPMHPEVTRDTPDRCPGPWGMKLLPAGVR